MKTIDAVLEREEPKYRTYPGVVNINVVRFIDSYGRKKVLRYVGSPKDNVPFNDAA